MDEALETNEPITNAEGTPSISLDPASLGRDDELPRRGYFGGVKLILQCTIVSMFAFCLFVGFRISQSDMSFQERFTENLLRIFDEFFDEFRIRTPFDERWRPSSPSPGTLDLVRLYPWLEEGVSEVCKTAWQEHASRVPCHGDMLSAVFGGGNPKEGHSAKLDPFTSVQSICSWTCGSALSELQESMKEHCGQPTSRFSLSAYDRGDFAYQKKIEDNPWQVAINLEKRYKSFCHWYWQQDEGPTCSLSLWMRWGITDRDDDSDLSSVFQFLEKTNKKMTIDRHVVKWFHNQLYGTYFYVLKYLPTRRIGPGDGETDCGKCTQRWLFRKTMSYQTGMIVDPLTGEAVSRQGFYTLMEKAIRRCKHKESPGLERVRAFWKTMGWWCGSQPCNDEDTHKSVAQKVFHGLKENDSPLPEIRGTMQEEVAPKHALKALHDGLRSLPCSIWFSEEEATTYILPHADVLTRICSRTCRNAVDRLRIRHEAEFNAIGDDNKIFAFWASARDQLDKMCSADEFDNSSAPGYAAFRWFQRLFRLIPPSRKEKLAVFSKAIEDLNHKPPLSRNEELDSIGIFEPYCKTDDSTPSKFSIMQSLFSLVKIIGFFIFIGLKAFATTVREVADRHTNQ